MTRADHPRTPRRDGAAARCAVTALLAAVLAFAVAGGCAATGSAGAPGGAGADERGGAGGGEGRTVGRITRAQVERASREWARAYERARPRAQAVEALGSIVSESDEPIELVIVLGAWCPDSLREVPRLWKALSQVESDSMRTRVIGVDREFEAGEASLEGLGVEAVPTIIVRRGGEELGRIVEDAPHAVEVDVLRILRGDARGTVSETR
jgi:hypothetical protein